MRSTLYWHATVQERQLKYQPQTVIRIENPHCINEIYIIVACHYTPKVAQTLASNM